jgi:hypothetical protein
MANSLNDSQLFLADALLRLITELDARIEDMETSVPGEWVVPDPIRGTPLYSAVQSVERHYDEGKLPVEPRLIWIEMLCLTDEEHAECDAQDSYKRFYKHCAELRAWAVKESGSPHDPVGPFTRCKWASLLDCSERTVQGMQKHPKSAKGRIYFPRDDLPPDIDHRIANEKKNGK